MTWYDDGGNKPPHQPKPVKPLELYVYWSCMECGNLTTTENSLPGPCRVCWTNCWQSPPQTRNEEEDE